MVDDLWWREQDADYIRRRGERYPGAAGIEPEWTLEAARDPQRTVGYSPCAGFVITVIATGSDHAGATAWKTSGADLRAYEAQGGTT